MAETVARGNESFNNNDYNNDYNKDYNNISYCNNSKDLSVNNSNEYDHYLKNKTGPKNEHLGLEMAGGATPKGEQTFSK